MSTASDAAAPAAGQQAPETGAPHKGALVFIDMQNIFADQDGQWGVSNYAEVEQAMAIMDCFNPMLTLMTVDEYLNA